MKKLNVIVLGAGTSTERDVSIVTSTKVCEALRKNGHKAEVVDVFLGIEQTVHPIEDIFEANTNLDAQAEALKARTPQIPELYQQRMKAGQSFFGPQVLEACQAADIVFMGLHGSNGEDGKIQGAFDLMGIPYTGTGYLSSAISMNKDLSKFVMENAGVPMPKGITLRMNKEDRRDCASAYERMKQTVLQQVGVPCVVKPCCGGSSVGVTVVQEEQELTGAFAEAFGLEDSVLVEQFVSGREFTVAVVNGKALPVVEIVPLQGFYDYKNKYQDGMTEHPCPAHISAEVTGRMQEYAVLAAKAVGLETYGRVDCMMDADENIYCLEMNTLPGMTGTSLVPIAANAMGMSYEELCDYLIQVSLEKYCFE